MSSEAEHIGVVLSVSGNNRGALASVLHTGLAHGYRDNSASFIQIHKLYALPVLHSGISTHVLTSKELDMLEHHFRETIRMLQRLHEKTPRCDVYFLAGSLQGDAHVHLRQLSLFRMICRQPNFFFKFYFLYDTQIK